MCKAYILYIDYVQASLDWIRYGILSSKQTKQDFKSNIRHQPKYFFGLPADLISLIINALLST